MTFIERLTDEQIRTYLDKEYSRRGYKYSFYKHDLLSVLCVRFYRKGDALSVSIRFCDYYAENGSRQTRTWVSYLYNVFGEEYKQAYLEWCNRAFFS